MRRDYVDVMMTSATEMKLKLNSERDEIDRRRDDLL